MKPTCRYCEWFVEETDTIGDYQHSEAIKQGVGFCLIKDLFTEALASDEACADFQKESE